MSKNASWQNTLSFDWTASQAIWYPSQWFGWRTDHFQGRERRPPKHPPYTLLTHPHIGRRRKEICQPALNAYGSGTQAIFCSQYYVVTSKVVAFVHFPLSEIDVFLSDNLKRCYHNICIVIIYIWHIATTCVQSWWCHCIVINNHHY
jgi:hypothetical protein